MDRRHFLKTASIAAPASLLAQATGAQPTAAARNVKDDASNVRKTWLFWDWWHVEHQDNVDLCQGEATWRPEGTYEDPTFDYLGCWPTVWRDGASGMWRMLYFGSGYPLTLLGAESRDGVEWQPMNRPEIHPSGEKLAPNHLFTVPAANGGPVYLDPVAADGRPFKFYCIQRGGPAAESARLDPNAFFHEIVSGEGVKNYLAEQLIVSSADGLHWQVEDKARWGRAPWHPDPPVNCFYNAARGQHVMTTRPGWGDRRIAVQTSTDALAWRDLELLMQPDPLDPPQVQFYGMPVVPYEGQFVGLLWTAHFSSSEPLERFNQLWGPIDCQLAYSFDGVHFQRGTRKPLVRLNEPGEPASGVVYPTCMIEAEDELRIYSGTTRDLHHQYAKTQYLPKGKVPPSAITLHTLRKDGFTYLASRGNWANLTTKPLAFLEPGLTVNAAAAYGEIVFQATDLKSQALEGYTFGDCIAIEEDDGVRLPVRWKDKDVSDLVGKVIRLQVRFRNARIYALRGAYHFLDALDVSMIDDGKGVDTSLFDF